MDNIPAQPTPRVQSDIPQDNASTVSSYHIL